MCHYDCLGEAAVRLGWGRGNFPGSCHAVDQVDQTVIIDRAVVAEANFACPAGGYAFSAVLYGRLQVAQ